MHFIDRAGETLKGGGSPEAIGQVPVLRRLRRLGEELAEDDSHEVARIWAAIDRQLSDIEAGGDSDARRPDA